MATTAVVALFGSKAEAENAIHRLHSEGVPDGDIAERKLREVVEVSPAMEQVETPEPFFFGLLGSTREDYRGYLRNGETLVVVRAASEEQAATISELLKLFVPLRVDLRGPA